MGGISAFMAPRLAPAACKLQQATLGYKSGASPPLGGAVRLNWVGPRLEPDFCGKSLKFAERRETGSRANPRGLQPTRLTENRENGSGEGPSACVAGAHGATGCA